MDSAEKLRAESRRLREAINNICDPLLKQEFAARALDLAQRAEAMADSFKNTDLVRANIRRYRRMLAVGVSREAQKRIIEEALDDADNMLSATKNAVC